MSSTVRIERLAHHPDLLPLLAVWFQSEWPAYYGPNGAADAVTDLRAYSNCSVVPVGLVAFRNNEVCGVAALKAQSIGSRPNLGPWAGAGFVPPQHRRQGIGGALLRSVESVAKELGFPRVYCATSTSASLLELNRWHLLERTTHEGEPVDIYEKAL
jgi:predicted N-acetyltransferase YhbS